MKGILAIRGLEERYIFQVGVLDRAFDCAFDRASWV
jgi:hypothetical protein